VVGPVPFEALPEQINASAVLVRQAGEADWTPVTAVLPAMTPTAAQTGQPRSDFESEFDAPEARATKVRLTWPLAAVALAFLALAGGWVYHRVTLAGALESQQADDADSPTSQRRRGRSSEQNGKLAGQVRKLEQRLTVVDYRRQLLIEINARQERKLAAQIQQLQTATRSRRFRRFRGGFDPPDDEAARALMTDFRRRLALAWAATLARRQDAAAETSFLAAEVQRLSGVPANIPLQPHDRELLKQNGVKYRTEYNRFYTSAHKELTLYMDYATTEELVLLASHERLSFPSSQLPSDFAAAVKKLRK
jgi:hypothetical protein